MDEKTIVKIEKYDYIYSSPLKTLKTYLIGNLGASTFTIPMYALGVSSGGSAFLVNFGAGIGIALMQDAEKNKLSKFSNYDGSGYKIILTQKEATIIKTKIYTKEFYFNSNGQFIVSFQYKQVNCMHP